MDTLELTKLFIEYKETLNRLHAIENVIKNEVLKISKSQTMAGINAKYFKETQKVDYEAAARAAEPPIELISKYTTKVERLVTDITIDWKSIVDELQVDLDPFTKKTPSRVLLSEVEQ